MRPTPPDYVQRIIPYVPGKPIEEVERELGISGSVKLASNENPVGPSPTVVEAILQNAQKVNLYPDGDSFYLKQALAAFLGIERAQLLVGNGSNDVIEMALHTFARPGREVVSAKGAFIVCDLATRAMGAISVQVPMRDHTHDLKAMAAAIAPQTDAVYLANPNNPTGTMVAKGELSAFLEAVPKSVLVISDEAYGEYVENPDFPNSLALLPKHPNLLVIRTFSKAYGLAGLRVGFAVAHAELVAEMDKVRQPFNVNALAQVAALAALRDQEHIARVVAMTRAEKRRIYAVLDSQGREYIPSETNFVLINVAEDGQKVFEALLKKGVITRPVRGYGYPDWLRVTVGMPDENDRFLTALAEVLDRRTKG